MAKVTAATLATEFGSFSRSSEPFRSWASRAWCHASIRVDREVAAAPSPKQETRICARVLLEAAWHYRHRPKLISAKKSCNNRSRRRWLQPPAEHKSASIAATGRWRTRSKPTGKIVTALAHELAGFVWRSASKAKNSPRAKRTNFSQSARNRARQLQCPFRGPTGDE
jgi:transposase